MSVLPTILDSSKADSIEKWTKKTLEHYGGVDLLVVNAGGPPPGKFEIFTDEDWMNAFELNLMSAVRMIRSVLPSMRSRGGGSILTITSSSVKEPIDVSYSIKCDEIWYYKPRKKFILTVSM